MNAIRHTLILAALAATALAACGQSGTQTAVVPLEISHGTSCALDGMLLADYPGPKAQVHYAGQAEPDFFCDTVEMFNIYLSPEQVRAVQGLFVQDMGRADWDVPRDHWIDAKTAYYVHGSKRRGSMGPTIASFAQEHDAVKFAAEYGGKVYRFADITPDMVVLDGGALHDSNM
ncbi:MAG: nitrous oxide reductase accessory protein NosL [Gammaproteobacteria bacterium]|nr:nitrous oxide reductase accessory protein NosL [Gammaproteobacteria bacterium]